MDKKRSDKELFIIAAEDCQFAKEECIKLQNRLADVMRENEQLKASTNVCGNGPACCHTASLLEDALHELENYKKAPVYKVLEEVITENYKLRYGLKNLAKNTSCSCSCSEYARTLLEMLEENMRLREELRKIANGNEDPMDIAHIALHHSGNE